MSELLRDQAINLSTFLAKIISQLLLLLEHLFSLDPSQDIKNLGIEFKTITRVSA